MSEKKSLEEQSSKLTLAANAWLKPARQWLTKANSICKVAKSDDLIAKKELCQEIFGSNLILKTKQAQPTAAQTAFPPKNIWPVLRAAKEKAAQMGDNFSESLFLVLNEAKVIHPTSLDSFAVQRLEVQRWRDILAVPYANYKSMLVPR